MNISIIIPVYNEEKNISNLIYYLRNNSEKKNISEFIIVDGGSQDNTVNEAIKTKATVLKSIYKSRAIQMNLGAEVAKGNILYFLHADSFPPPNFDRHIIEAINKGYYSGCFRMKWDINHWSLNIFSWLTRFNCNICRGGDQSLFIKSDIFDKIGGYNDKKLIMEDTEIIPRIKRNCKFKVIIHYLISSGRRYKKNGIIKLQLLYGIIYFLHFMGYSEDSIIKFYKKHII